MEVTAWGFGAFRHVPGSGLFSPRSPPPQDSEPAATSPQGTSGFLLVLCSIGFPSCQLPFFPPAGRDDKTRSQSFLQLAHTIPWTSLRLTENNRASWHSGEPGGWLPLDHLHPHLPIFLLKLFCLFLMECCLSEVPWAGRVGGEVPLHPSTVMRQTVLKKGREVNEFDFLSFWLLIRQNKRTELKASQVLLFSHMYLWTFLRSLAVCSWPGLEATTEASSSICPSGFQLQAIMNRSVVHISVSFGRPDAPFST